MISFEWLEFETLSRDVAHLEDQISAAKAAKNFGRMRVLEPQLEAANERRAKALEAIARQAASAAAELAPESDKAKQVGPVVAETAAASADIQFASELTDQVTENAPFIATQCFESTGDIIMWDRLTPDHLDQAKRELVSLRAEMLARHAEEFKSLDVDQDEIDALDRAINAFTQKFSVTAAVAEVVQLDEDRELQAS